MLLLLRNDKTGSAFGLARSVVEAMHCGMWINFVATDVELERFERTDEMGLNMTELACATDAGYHAEDFF